MGTGSSVPTTVLPLICSPGGSPVQAGIINDEIRELILSGGTAIDIKKKAAEGGMIRDIHDVRVRETDEGEQLDLTASTAWAMVDHQFSHVFVRDADAKSVQRVARSVRMDRRE